MPNDNVLTADARATIMDACQSISRSADALKECHTVDGDWGDDIEAKAHYEAELRLLDRLTNLLATTQQPSGEVTDDDKVCAERYRWMAERFLGADFEWGRGEDGYGGIPALVIEIPETAKVWGCLDLTIDDQLSRTPASEGEQK
ncbi:hypothetical protein [Burkholderia multivorans]|uniref:hypothetical protein n=1 Tax=Burkholderia multivorans TaxID=87883 RepID=UPI002863E85C|nr:hypothetical protein [Burkholderia multivorans]MDR8873592.1 hypothetical protein [Burkholderia multivorans]MDR8890481.1 hypothetical protein [Burkholderia multivorans]MDR8891744.1 hypothetical protein [Burkholderia multivorans]MDR8898370.1 hypothetical protein [Burkholderia multivorans]MDR8904011.1 hypothetical protein [Burkholderia multivorans]